MMLDVLWASDSAWIGTSVLGLTPLLRDGNSMARRLPLALVRKQLSSNCWDDRLRELYASREIS